MHTCIQTSVCLVIQLDVYSSSLMYVYTGRYIPSDEALFGQRHYTKAQLSERKYWDVANSMYLSTFIYIYVCVHFLHVCTAGGEFIGKVTIIIIVTISTLTT